MVKIYFVPHEEVIDAFKYLYIYIPKMEILSFHIDHVRIIGSMEWNNTRNDSFHESS